MYVKLAVITLLVTMLGAAGFWAVTISSENVQLKSDLATTITANESYVSAIEFMNDQALKREQDLANKLKLQSKQKEQIYALRKSLRRVKSEALTVKQRECIESAIPKPVLNLLRVRPEGGSKGGRNKSVPKSGDLLRDRGAGVSRRDLGRLGNLYKRVAAAHRAHELGQTFYQTKL